MFFASNAPWDPNTEFNYFTLTGDPTWDTSVVSWYLAMLGYGLVIVLTVSDHVKYAALATLLIIARDWIEKFQAFGYSQEISALIPLSGISSMLANGTLTSDPSGFYLMNFQTISAFAIAVLALWSGRKSTETLEITKFKHTGQLFCGNCGTEVSPSEFCPQCGKKL
jgi:hypothetical protein